MFWLVLLYLFFLGAAVDLLIVPIRRGLWLAVFSDLFMTIFVCFCARFSIWLAVFSGSIFAPTLTARLGWQFFLVRSLYLL